MTVEARRDAINTANNGMQIDPTPKGFILTNTETGKVITASAELEWMVNFTEYHIDRRDNPQDYEPNRADKAAAEQSGLPAFFYYVQRKHSQPLAEFWLEKYREAQARTTQ